MMIAEQGETIKVCPKCDATFTCTPVDCWCAKLPLIMPMHPDAACYCPGCLEAIIDEQIKEKQLP